METRRRRGFLINCIFFSPVATRRCRCTRNVRVPRRDRHDEGFLACCYPLPLRGGYGEKRKTFSRCTQIGNSVQLTTTDTRQRQRGAVENGGPSCVCSDRPIKRFLAWPRVTDGSIGLRRKTFIECDAAARFHCVSGRRTDFTIRMRRKSTRRTGPRTASGRMALNSL